LKAIRWFTAEFLVVLSGVLVAVALGNYFKQKEVASTNKQYLIDLLVELKHNETEVKNNLSVERAGANGAKMLMLNIDTAENVPLDSIRKWMNACMNSTLNFRPAMGMVKTIITTGAVNSLSDLKLRSAIINYEQEATELIDFFNEGIQLEFEQVGKLIDQGHVNRLLVNTRSQQPIGFRELRKNEKYTKLYLMSYVLYNNRIVVYESYMEQVSLLKSALERALDLKPRPKADTKH
jgi:hypothetical protein